VLQVSTTTISNVVVLVMCIMTYKLRSGLSAGGGLPARGAAGKDENSQQHYRLLYLLFALLFAD
jgi:hypothetical protein